MKEPVFKIKNKQIFVLDHHDWSEIRHGQVHRFLFKMVLKYLKKNKIKIIGWNL